MPQWARVAVQVGVGFAPVEIVIPWTVMATMRFYG
jgi:hypothetical protein